MSLGKITIRDTKGLRDKTSGKKVWHVYDPHALVQAAGYLKFRFAKDEHEGIFLRGQARLHRGLVPSLFRGIKRKETQEGRVARLNGVIAEFRKQCPILENLDDVAHEPLLQHYGLRTTWIDLVDNVWVALWFACHNAKIAGDKSQYLHFERRVPKTADDFAYILLIGADIEGLSKLLAGFGAGPNTELIDLRMASPSIFLRPHSQHALLFRARGNGGGRPLDYADQIRGVIRISLSDALGWLGDGKMLNTHSLFPPPFYDSGYEFLLSGDVGSDEVIGSIRHVGA